MSNKENLEDYTVVDEEIKNGDTYIFLRSGIYQANYDEVSLMDLNSLRKCGYVNKLIKNENR